MDIGGFLKGLFQQQGGSDSGNTVANILGALSPIIGGVATSRAGAKVAEANTSVANDRNRVDARAVAQRALTDKAQIETDRGRLDLDQRKFADDARGSRFDDAMRGSLAMNMQDVHANRPRGVPKIEFSGGLRPSAFGAEGKAAGSEMVRQAMLALMNGDKFDKLAPVQVMPELQTTPLPQANLLDKILGIAGPAMAGIDAINRLPRRQRVTVPDIAVTAGLPQMPGTPVPPMGQQRPTTPPFYGDWQY